MINDAGRARRGRDGENARLGGEMTRGRSRIYLDHAATSRPKPAGVGRAMARFGERLGASAGRGAYGEARAAERLLGRCRHRLRRLLGGASADRVIFTLNATDAIHLGLRGVVEAAAPARPHVITTQMDHNAVLRPCHALEAARRITVTRVPADPATGIVAAEDIARAFRPETTLVAVAHASNVTGGLQPVEAIAPMVRERGALLLVDAAQTAGHFPIDVENTGVDLLASPGHKGLLGPLGTGVLYVGPRAEVRMGTVREGGTGSRSERAVQPGFLPDRFEAGSHNAVGIAGLLEAVRWIGNHGVAVLRDHERTLTAAMIEGLEETRGVELIGPRDPALRCAVFSVRVRHRDGSIRPPATVAAALERRHGLLTRAGLHCAPGAHRTMGTEQEAGTTRLSFGPFLGMGDVQRTLRALAEEAETARGRPQEKIDKELRHS